MRGITEERLREKLSLNLMGDMNIADAIVHECLVDLINECQELNQWKKIETAPKDRKILLFDGEIFIGQWWLSDWTDWKDHERIVNPSHWMELPEPPK